MDEDQTTAPVPPTEEPEVGEGTTPPPAPDGGVDPAPPAPEGDGSAPV
jgi:hypothetical protein